MLEHKWNLRWKKSLYLLFILILMALSCSLPNLERRPDATAQPLPLGDKGETGEPGAFTDPSGVDNGEDEVDFFITLSDGQPQPETVALPVVDGETLPDEDVDWLLDRENVVQEIRKTIGFDRILFATNYPYSLTPDMGGGYIVSGIKANTHLTQKEKRKILGENAARLLGLN